MITHAQPKPGTVRTPTTYVLRVGRYCGVLWLCSSSFHFSSSAQRRSGASKSEKLTRKRKQEGEREEKRREGEKGQKRKELVLLLLLLLLQAALQSSGAAACRQRVAVVLLLFFLSSLLRSASPLLPLSLPLPLSLFSASFRGFAFVWGGFSRLLGDRVANRNNAFVIWESGVRKEMAL